MAEEAKELFEKYITEGRARMKEKGMLFSPKHEPTFVEHYGELESYVARVGLRRTEAQQFALDRNLKHEMARMNGTDQEANFLGLLCKMSGYKKIVEVGTFLGYTTLVLAESVPDAKIITLDIGDEFLQEAKKNWTFGRVDHKIEVMLAPAAVSLQKLLDLHGEGSFDFVFIDADKENYGIYYELALKLVRKGGCVAVDNVLWSGQPAKPEFQDPSTVAIRALNEKIAKDERVDVSLLTMADGVTLCVKK